MIEIREANISDIPVLRDMFTELSIFHSSVIPSVVKAQGGYTDDQIRELLFLTDKYLLVAEKDNSVCGFACCSQAEYPETSVTVRRKVLRINDLFVYRNCRNSGIGKALIDEIERFATRNRFDYIELNCYVQNKDAMAFYDRVGYLPSAVVLNKKVK